MRRLGAGFLLCAVLWCTQAAAQPYVKLFGGAGFTQSEITFEPDLYFLIDRDDSFSLVSLEENGFSDLARMSVGASPVFGGALGYEVDFDFPGRVRFELEASHSRGERGVSHDVLILQQKNGNSKHCLELKVACDASDFVQDGAEDFFYAKFRSIAVLANALYVSPKIADRWSLYGGGGLGFAVTDFDFQQLNSEIEIIEGVRVLNVANEAFHSTRFTAQIMGGISMNVAPNVELFAEGRWRHGGGDSTSPEISSTSALIGVQFFIH